ncbi:unnamed protein product, partial [Brenthis ino]
MNPKKLHDSSQIHKWPGRKCMSSECHVERFKELLELVQNDLDETFPILQSFVKGWIDKYITNLDKSKCHNDIMKWGAYFLDFHIITLILNSVNSLERVELTKIKGVRMLSADSQDAIVYSSDNFGKVLIVSGFCLFINEGILIDRNTTLMFKDVFVARFQTLFSMVNIVDDKFRSNDWKRIQKMYNSGDKILAIHGNKAYKAIKLVEPISSLKLSELAHEYRKQIPDFPNYKLHILQSIEDTGKELRGVATLANSINNLETPDLVLTAYGSFRHWGHPNLKYLDGLRAVNRQVTLEKMIDTSYAEALGSDLAYIVLENKFNETKKWYVDISKMDKDSIMYKHVLENTWPTPKQIMDFGEVVLKIKDFFMKEKQSGAPNIPFERVNERVAAATGLWS